MVHPRALKLETSNIQHPTPNIQWRENWALPHCKSDGLLAAATVKPTAMESAAMEPAAMEPASVKPAVTPKPK